MSKMKPGSIASEAARLTVELGILVTPDKVKWWRKKRYPMSDTPALLKCIRNQERIAGDPDAFKKLQAQLHPTAETAPEMDGNTEYEPEPPTMADLLISDQAIENATGFVSMSEVLDYLRDQWQASEMNVSRYANKSESEIEKIVRRDVASNFANLKIVMPSVARPPWPDWLDEFLYPDESKSLQAGDDSATDPKP